MNEDVKKGIILAGLASKVISLDEFDPSLLDALNL